MIKNILYSYQSAINTLIYNHLTCNFFMYGPAIYILTRVCYQTKLAHFLELFKNLCNQQQTASFMDAFTLDTEIA